MKTKKTPAPSEFRLELPSLDQALISPLNLNVRYDTPRSEMDLLPFLDMVLIGLLFFMLSSRMVFAPGVVVDLPDADELVLQTALVSEVLTVSARGGKPMFFFRGAVYDEQGLRGLIPHGDAAREPRRDHVLLLKMDSVLTVQMQSDLVSLARQMGYGKVQVALDVAAPKP
jgi:biopolymer transport protein ExbD